jgi:hypothetical protein
MKPHLLRLRGIWHCHLGGLVGIGYSPKDAYTDWEKLARYYNAEARRLKKEQQSD